MRKHRATNTTARRMATVMVNQVTGQRACTLDDLIRAGFRETEIIEHRGEAIRMASVQLRERGLDIDIDPLAA